MTQQFLVHPGKPMALADYDPGFTGGHTSKAETKAELKRNGERLRDLQEVLWAENKHALLIVLQALDAGGKDGTIKHVMRGVNPQGCQVTSFKVPTDEELEHDYLWRVHKATPRRGDIGIFNRSHYEDVLVVRVHNLVPEAVWQQRYEQINEFEKMLADTGTTILKFFLHISKEEQKERFEDRLRRPDKNWKFNPDDLKTRAQWGDYMRAFEDVFAECNHPWAPWYIVPSNRKWYRNLVVSSVIVEAMEKMDMRYPPAPEGLEGIVIE